MLKTFLIFIFIFLSGILQAKIYKINSQADYNKIRSIVRAGDEVLISKGFYKGWNIDIDLIGTERKPIIIRGEGSQTIFSGDVNSTTFKISGAFIVLKDIRFEENNLISQKGQSTALIELNASNQVSIKNCSFIRNRVSTQFTPLVIISGYAKNNTISKCLFRSNIDSQDVQVKIANGQNPENTTIERNLFIDKPKVTWKNGNGGECVQIGQDPVLLGNLAGSTLVFKNRFIHCDGENEVISNKSSGNKFIRNFFEQNDGELVMRGGNDCLIERNKFSGGTGGIRVNGTGHVIRDNKIRGIKNAIRLMYGMAAGGNETGFYIAAGNIVITGNQISNAETGILIGDSKNVDWTGKFDLKRYPSRVIQDVPPSQIQILNNSFRQVQFKVITR